MSKDKIRSHIRDALEKGSNEAFNKAFRDEKKQTEEQNATREKETQLLLPLLEDLRELEKEIKSKKYCKVTFNEYGPLIIVKIGRKLRFEIYNHTGSYEICEWYPLKYALTIAQPSTYGDKYCQTTKEVLDFFLPIISKKMGVDKFHKNKPKR